MRWISGLRKYLQSKMLRRPHLLSGFAGVQTVFAVAPYPGSGVSPTRTAGWELVPPIEPAVALDRLMGLESAAASEVAALERMLAGQSSQK